MRIALVILVLALAACGKKKSPQAPAASESSELKQDADEKDVNAPAQGEDANETRTSDPQEGGE